MKNPKSNGCGSNAEWPELPYAIAMRAALRSEREMGCGEIQLVLGYKDDTVDHDLVVNVARHRIAKNGNIRAIWRSLIVGKMA